MPARRVFCLCALAFALPLTFCAAQEQPVGSALEDRIRTLSEAMSRVEAQMQESQRELTELRQQLADLRRTAGVRETPSSSELTGAAALADAVASLRETSAIHESQIATLEQTKAESASKYPLKLSGMILMTGFANTAKVDMPATPVIALSGGGSTGATFQQTILGLDVSGPHVLGARSHADIRFDLDGSSGSGYGNGMIRLRTAHAELNWQCTSAFFSLDRPILSPETPTSITAVAEPALAWSGNLWAWNPQLGVSREILPSRTGSLRMEAALIDIGDPPTLYISSPSTTYLNPGTAENSRWPGAETRIAFESSDESEGLKLGVSGLFAPHRTTSYQTRFDSWAGALDFRIPVTHLTQISGAAYRGVALGGLGAGAYKDYVSRVSGGEIYLRPLADGGGWLQWKQKATNRLEFNEAFGLDNVPAHQLRPYAIATPVSYYNLARNRTFTGNVIYSPNAYVLFSLEYRRIASSYVTAPTQFSDLIGIGAGYKF